MNLQGIPYRHYKGGIYLVYGTGRHTESREQLVAYSDDRGELHFRPTSMFYETVTVNGKQIPRFEPM